MMEGHEWTPLPSDAPFPQRMQGEWVEESNGETVLVIEGRRIEFCGRELPVNDLSLIEEGGHFAVQNFREDIPSQLPWGQVTLHVFWFEPGSDELNFHGICDHGWAVRAPGKRDS